MKAAATVAWFAFALLAICVLGVLDDIVRHGLTTVVVVALLPVAFWLGRRSRGTNLVLASRVKYRRLRHYGSKR